MGAGAPQHVCAPMVEQSELAFRILCRRYGTTLCYTPMFHSRLFLEDSDYRDGQFGPLDGCPEDRPLFAQFCANDPPVFAAAANIVEKTARVDAIDLNLGCPQGIAKRGNYGSFLMDDIPLVFKLVNAVHTTCSVPITVKIRVFPGDEERTLAYAKAIQDAGAQVLTVHGRGRDNKGPGAELADWDMIKKVREHLSIPVISNGNIVTFGDVEACLEATGAAGVMSAEWLRRNPALFWGGKKVCAFQMAQEYLELLSQYPCPLSFVKSHLFKLLATVDGGFNDHGELRERMGKTQSLPEVVEIVEELQRKRNGQPSYPTGTREDLLPQKPPPAPPRERKKEEEEGEEGGGVDIFSLEF